MSTKRIVILGNSAAAASAIQEIRKTGSTDEITLVSEDNLPFNREMLADLLIQELSEEKILSRPESFYKDNAVSLMLGKKVARINLRRNQITFEDKEAISFDTLLLAGSLDWRLPEAKGSNKTGVFLFKKASVVKEMAKLLPLTETVIIESNSLQGIRLACAARKKGRETILIVPSANLLSDVVDQETSQSILQALEEKGISVVLDSGIVEILGDAEAKAVKLKSGKVISGEMIIYTEAQPDLRMYKETLLETDGRIAVDEAFKTALEHVLAVDEVCEIKDTSYSSELLSQSVEEQGRVAGAWLSGQSATFSLGAVNIPAQLGELLDKKEIFSCQK